MDRRALIIDAALAAYEATGSVSIEEVKKRSGASIGSIYHHFGSKEGIAAALYIEVMRDYQAGALRTLRQAKGAKEGVTGLVSHHLRWVAGNPERARFLMRGGSPREAGADELRGLNRELADAVESWVATQDAVRPLSLPVFYATVVGPAQELSRLWLAGTLPSLAAIEADLADAAWRAVRADA